MKKQARGKRYVVKNKTRFFMAVILVFLSAAGILFTSRSYSFEEPSYITIRVRQGDTLWSIASTYNTDRDIRRFIFDIKNLNDLPGSVIYEGQFLVIPESRR